MGFILLARQNQALGKRVDESSITALIGIILPPSVQLLSRPSAVTGYPSLRFFMRQFWPSILVQVLEVLQDLWWHTISDEYDDTKKEEAVAGGLASVLTISKVGPTEETSNHLLIRLGKFLTESQGSPDQL
jgi:hypothetical protein